MFQLPPTIQAADGRKLYTGSSTATRALTVATDEDWAECLTRARLAIRKGTKAIDADGTWEDGLAAVAAWYLRMGVGEDAMGRTPDEAVWEEQEARWVEMTLAAGAEELGSQVLRYHELNKAGDLVGEAMTREEIEARSFGEDALLGVVMVPDPDPRVLTTSGWVRFADMRRYADVEESDDDTDDGSQ